MNDIAILLGQRIRALRTTKGLSQEELAFRASISTNHLGQIERAIKNPTLDTINKIAQALEVSLPELLDFNTATQANETENVIINKILAQLSTTSLEQQQDILKLIKIFKHYQETE